MKLRILTRAVLLAIGAIAATIAVGFLLAKVLELVMSHTTIFLTAVGIIGFAALVISIMLEMTEDGARYGDRGPDG